jgi:hypothetical protein
LKVTIIEGTPEELAEYEARTGAIGTARVAEDAPAAGGDLVPARDGQAIGGADVEDTALPWSFISGRARTQEIGERVEAYVRRVLDLGGAEVEPGTSRASRDGRADYLRVYNAGSRRYGAVAYVNARNAGLTLRLTREDVADVADSGLKFRDVQQGNGYQVNCPVKTPEGIDLAVRLTQRALDKLR